MGWLGKRESARARERESERARASERDRERETDQTEEVASPLPIGMAPVPSDFQVGSVHT